MRPASAPSIAARGVRRASALVTWLRELSWPEVVHHPWRNAAALLAVVLGVALAFSVHLINASALAEFGAAVRAVGGQADVRLVGTNGGSFDESLYATVAATPGVAVASPIVEVDTYAFDAASKRVALRVEGIDALVAPQIAPAIVPRPRPGEDRFAVVDPDAIFLNAAAEKRLGIAVVASDATGVSLQTAGGRRTWRIAGSVASGGPPLAVVDIAGAQVAFGRIGRLDRIDVRLATGVDRAAFERRLALPAGVRVAGAEESGERVANVSRAYRANLTVLAFVAMFTGAFLVYSILALSVAKRQPQLALLGVLGLSGRDRRLLVLGESALLGIAGSVLGLVLGAALAATALALFGGDLGGGYFAGVAPALRIDPWAALGHGALGVAAALVGGWLPARAAERIAPAQALKGLGSAPTRRATLRTGLALVLAGAALATLPPIAGLPLAAYASVACLLVGGIACVPGSTGWVLGAVREPRGALALLAVERARHERSSATIAVAGVVASLALSVALTVMVASFRDAVTRWLDTVLPADLYARVAAGPGRGDIATLPASLPEAARTIEGVVRVEAQRAVPVVLDPARPAVTLIARSLSGSSNLSGSSGSSGPTGPSASVGPSGPRDPSKALPITGDVVTVPAGAIGAYVSEAVVDLYGASPGKRLAVPLADGRTASLFVAGVWRDYARQYGAIVVDAGDWRRLSGDDKINDLALWLAPNADLARIESSLRALAERGGFDGALIEFAAPREIRVASLRIFDRSFAVTYWLQAVAIAIGLFGIAASFSAQVLARRKEFGLLVHLGLTRRQILAVVAAEGAIWTAVGALLGLGLGAAVSVVLVQVVNPQSFHWTMDMLWPWSRLAMLCAAVVVAGTLTAWASARRAVGRQTVLAVKEDW